MVRRRRTRSGGSMKPQAVAVAVAVGKHREDSDGYGRCRWPALYGGPSAGISVFSEWRWSVQEAAGDGVGGLGGQLGVKFAGATWVCPRAPTRRRGPAAPGPPPLSPVWPTVSPPLSRRPSTMSTTRRPVIGIFGAGKSGVAIARLALHAGYTVHIASSRTADDTDQLLGFVAPGAVATTAGELPERADLLVIAVPLRRFRELPLDALGGHVVVELMNYRPPIDGTLPEFRRRRTPLKHRRARRPPPEARRGGHGVRHAARPVPRECALISPTPTDADGDGDGVTPGARAPPRRRPAASA
jgi:hypothetical protein